MMRNINNQMKALNNIQKAYKTVQQKLVEVIVTTLFVPSYLTSLKVCSFR